MRRTLRRIGIAVAGLTGIVVLAVAVVVAFGITLSLEAFRPDIEAAAESALGRKVRIEGPLTLLPALRPTVEIRSVAIADATPSDTSDFARIGSARVTLQLLPLTRREIHLDEIAIEGVEIRLAIGPDGEGNWIFAPEQPDTAVDSPGEPSFEFVRLGALSIRDVAVDYHGEGSDESIAVAVESIEGSAGRDDPTVLTAKGIALEKPFDLSLTGGSLAGLSDSGRPWPIDVQAKLADAVASLQGGIADPLGAPNVDVRIEGAIGKTTFRGDVAIELLSKPPRISGSVDIAALDLEPYLTHESPAPETPTEFSLDDMSLSLQGLHDLDADVTFTADRVLGLPMDIRDATVSPVIDGGRLTAPIEATVSAVPVEGMLAVESTPDALGFEIALASEGSDIENLRAVTRHAKGVKGSFERFSLRGSGRGHNLRAALEDLDVHVLLDRADLSYGHEDREKPIPLMLEAFELTLPRGQPLRLATRGTLFDRDFSVEAAGATIAEALSGGAWPIDLSATGAGARLSLAGSVADLGDLSGTVLDLDFRGTRIGDLATWIGTTPGASAAYRIRGRLHFEDDRVRFESARVSLGGTELTGDFAAGRRGHDLPLDARVRFPQIATAELAAMFPSRDAASEGVERPGLHLHMPILPYEVTIADADFDIRADRIMLQPADVTDARFKGRIREGRLKKSPFAATVAKVPLSGGVSLDLRGRVPVATLDVSAENVDVGSLLKDLQIIESSETRARRLHANMVFRGSTLKTIIEKSEISAVLEDGVTVIRDPNTQAPLEIRIIKSTLTSAPGELVVYDVQGRIESTPVTIRVETGPLTSILESQDSVPVRVTSEVAGINVELKASLTPPFNLRNLRFDLAARGRNLDSLDDLLHVSVPPWGPYSVDGTIQLDRVGYHAPRLEVRVGSSHLSGDVSLDTTGGRPRLIMNLTGKTLQLNDFDAGNWSAFEFDGPDAASGDQGNRSASLRERTATVQALVTSERLRSLDARVSLLVNEVLSGADRLGSGRLIASLDNGRLTLDPVSVEISEGSADGRFSFEMTEHAVDTRMRIEIDHLDYGVLARRIDIENDAAGWLSLDFDLRSRSDTLENMMAGASGQFDFAVWPTNMQAGIFDLWAANLLLAILPSLDSESGSRVNCVVGVFDVTDGIMRQQRLLIDTTNVQVAGEGEVDFQNGEVDFMLIPNAKRPQMFVLGTPIRVKGNYWELETSASADQWARTAARFVASIFAPIKRIFTTPIPADGEAACLAAMERPAE
jgi:uncharacterized protein involved in outer membrane biogenesis